MKFNTNAPAAAPTTPRQMSEMKYKRSRANLLMVVLLTIFNLISYPFVSFYFPFSATIPCYEMHFAFQENPEVAFADLLFPIVIGIILTVPYLLCWIFSKKRVGWMVAALVFFSLDCILLLTMYDLTAVIIDILFHAWVMFYLITGVSNGFKLKKMPEDEPLPAFGEVVTENETTAEGETAMPAFDESLFDLPTENTEAAEDNNTSSEE